MPVLPCLLFEDEHLLVVNKPAGLNTHAPRPYAGEGLYEWLRHREPRWANLAIIHRLDKETSGVMVFSKTSPANRSLTEQFTRRAVRKRYLLLTDRQVPTEPFTVRSGLVRVGERSEVRSPKFEVRSSKLPRGTEVLAETQFSLLGSQSGAGSWDFGLGGAAEHEARELALFQVEAQPLTGRTHQIRVHAAHRGFPILGDILYGGTPSPRVCLHAAEITLEHPVMGQEMTFRAPADFQADARLALRMALIDPAATNACRLIHGASEGCPGWFVERLGDFLLSESSRPPDDAQRSALARLMEQVCARGLYHKNLTRQIRLGGAEAASPRHVLGEVAPPRFVIRENGLQFEISFGEGYSVGLFLDQRENRRRLLTGHVAAGFSLFEPAVQPAFGHRPFSTLNAFAYTCGFSVCAAKAGARATSLDLSKKYLDWGRRNFELNQIDPAGHDFIFGDVFDWLRRLAKKRQVYDLILLDPPTFSQSKQSGTFRAERDYGKLVAAALPLLKAGGVLLASTNAADWAPEKFLAEVEAVLGAGKRRIVQRHYVPQPPDFPVTRAEPAYLKTAWLRVD